jgi:NitT/TauT family transport system ATP-binding protein
MNAMADVVAATSPARAGASVEVAAVTRRFPLAGGGEVTALSAFDLALAPGAFVAVVGPSGCGKSTLLRLIAGLDAPDAGSIRIDGEAPQSAAARHRIGVAFQDHALLPWLSARQNVALPFRLAGMPVDESRVEALVAMVGLADFAASRPAHLSGGMRQRVSIARSIALQPSLLLLDEPFGALDLVTRRALNLEMQRVWESFGATTLLITHSVDEAVQLADRVIVMASRPGRVHATFDVALERPRTRATTQGDAFSSLVRRVSAALDDAMTAA